MNCHCCQLPLSMARKVKLRPWRELDAELAPPGSEARDAYEEEMVYRWAVVCPACYLALDNITGIAEVGGRLYQMAGTSRADRAATIDEAGYRAFVDELASNPGLRVDELDTE